MLSEKNIVRIILVLGFIHGLLFVFLMFPWEHYDEPAHFEYAWLIANRLRLPKPDDFDVDMRLDLGKSLIQSGFFDRRPGSFPNLSNVTEPLWAGVTQLTDPPLYYMIEAVPILALRGMPINTQLYGGRVISLAFLILTLWSAYQILCELTPPKSIIRWLVPLFLALLPGLVEFMSAINDHVAAIGLVSLWLVVAIRLIKRGLSPKIIAYLLLLDTLCYFTQKIAWIVLPFSILALILGLFRGKKSWIGWTIAGVALLGGILTVVQWNDTALWLRQNYQDLPTRSLSNKPAPINNAAQIVLSSDANWGQVESNWNAGLFQLLPEKQAAELNGKVVTIGAWMWSDKPVTVYGPGINSLYQQSDHWLGFRQVTVNSKPVFITSTFKLPDVPQHVQIWLRATTPGNPDATLYISGVILAKGQWPTMPPSFINSDGSKGTWGGMEFVNLVRNSLMQESWPYLKPRMLNFLMSRISGLDPTHVSSAISLLLDLKGTYWYTSDTAAIIFRSFWAKFGWDQVALLPIGSFVSHPYQILLLISLLGGLGFLVGVFVWRRQIPWNEGAFMIIFTLGVIMIAYFYGVYIMGGGLRFRVYFPVARYIYPAIIPFGTILVFGWGSWYALAQRWIKLRQSYGVILFIVLMLGLDIYSFISIVTYFRSF